MRRRRVVVAIVCLLTVGGVGWRYQSRLFGLGLRWYLSRVSAAETHDGTLDRRRAVVAGMHRALLMPPPPDVMVAELFDTITLLGERMVAGDVPLAWAAYLYTDYVRTEMQERPDAQPPRTPEQVATALDRVISFYAVRGRPGEDGVRVSDLLGAGAETYTKDEIEQAAREGRQLPLH